MGLAPCRAAWGQHPPRTSSSPSVAPGHGTGTARGPALRHCPGSTPPAEPSGDPPCTSRAETTSWPGLRDGGEAWERWRPPCTGGEGQPVSHPRRGALRCQRQRSGFISRPRAHVRHFSLCIKEPFHTRRGLPLDFLHILLLRSEHPGAQRLQLCQAGAFRPPGGASLPLPPPKRARCQVQLLPQAQDSGTDSARGFRVSSRAASVQGAPSSRGLCGSHLEAGAQHLSAPWLAAASPPCSDTLGSCHVLFCFLVPPTLLACPVLSVPPHPGRSPCPLAEERFP